MYATLPSKAKPSKCAAKPERGVFPRPHFGRVQLHQTPDGGWELLSTDSYKLARVRLEIHEEDERGPLTPGPISLDAMKAIERAGGFHANSHVVPVDKFGRDAGPTFARVDDGLPFPDCDQLMPETTGDEFTFAVSAKRLHELAEAFGQDTLRLTFVGKNGLPRADRCIMVTPLVGNSCSRGLVMPLRLNE